MQPSDFELQHNNDSAMSSAWQGAHHGDYDNMDFLRRQGAFDPPAAQQPDAVELRQAKRLSNERSVPPKTRATC